MVRKLTNLIAYLDERLGKHSGRGPEYLFYCPACSDRRGDESNKRKLGVNVAKGMGGCFRCGFAFRSLGQLFRYINGGYIRMEEFALLRNEVTLPTTDVQTAVRSRLVRKRHPNLKPYPLPPEFVSLSELSPEDRKALRYRLPFNYLASRGVSDEAVRAYQIGYCTTGDYALRLIFPVVQRGQIVYWTNRYCGDHPLKSKNPPNIEGFHQRGTCLLNYDNCVGSPRVALVEGPFSALAFDATSVARAVRGDAQDLLTPALAMMGKFLSNEQAALIAALVPDGLEEIVVALDPGAGSEADEAVDMLRGVVPKVSQLVLTDGDPADERERLPALLAARREPSVFERARQRLNG